jgi:hypothetical protein
MSFLTHHKRIIFFIILVLGGAIFLFKEMNQKAVIKTGVLSQRAQEYFKKQRETEGSTWQGVNTNEQTPIPESQTVSVSECFTLTIPFKIEMKREEHDCFVRYSLATPKGSIVTYLEDFAGPSLEQVSHIRYRLSKTDEYVQEQKKINNRDFMVFTKKGDRYEKDAFAVNGNKLFVMIFSTYTGAENDGKFWSMLESVRMGE